MKKLILIATVLLIAVSCKKIDRTPIGPTDIRIHNLTTKAMDEVTVDTGGGEYNFGLIKPDSLSAYHRYEKAYVKANISAMIDGNLYKTDTAIYTWMQYLGPDKVTYEIYIENDAQKKLAIFNVIHEEPLK